MTRIPKAAADEPETFAERFEARHGPFATEADRVIAFVEAHCRLSTGEWSGQPLRLRPWQRELVRGIFAAGPDGRRRHRIAYVGLPRKNGKSTVGAALALYGLLLGPEGSQVYSVAGDRVQAGIVFSAAKRMVATDPELKSMVKTFQRAMEHPERGSTYRVLSSDAPLQHGLSPTLVIFDEVWVQPDRELWDAMRLGMGAWPEPLLIAITTAGYRKDSLAYELFEHGRRVEAGEADDETFYFRWYASGGDWRDPDAWKASNPAFGDFLQADDFASVIRTTPESEFRRFRLNEWVATQLAALPAGAWEACARPDIEIPDGAEIVLGHDPSYSRDATALIACTTTEPHHLAVIDVWEQPPDDRAWRVPINDVIEAIRQSCRLFQVRELAFDPPHWLDIARSLEAEGLDTLVVEWATNQPARMSPAWMAFRDAVLDRRLTHDGDPRLARHVRNLVLREDRFGPRPTRDRNAPRSYIDAGIASIIAYDRAIVLPAEEREPLFAWA